MNVFCRSLAPLVLALAALSLVSVAGAEQTEDLGDHVVHYNTLNTSLLQPEVARAYGIQRSANRALLNIAVLKKSGDGQMNEAATARVTATAINLAGQRRTIEMQEIRDQEAIYYIGTFRIHDDETLNFRVQVQPTGASRSREFSFRQQFHTG